ncbi:MAG: phosphonopyruvate decarboxylase [Treponema sp.]|nr:phosphonopyruvate decarboxylase [Treponema sp.]MCL2250384.1 phosphonopyruvate decarboxylase [Treponema sp.]
MIDINFFYDQLIQHNVCFFTGVPDSLLKDFCAYITDNTKEKDHIIAVNEGAAAALAAGYHLATGKIPLVYMQNSGIGNAVNPLLSLADGDVYKIPMLLLVGWRGEPDKKDEPQHIKQGKVTCSLFDTMGIPYLILSDNEKDTLEQLNICYAHLKKENTPFALIVKKDTFSRYLLSSKTTDEKSSLTRERAIEEIILASSQQEVFISTTGMASRELFELREKFNMDHDKDFLTVGSMGHASSLALSIALQKPNLSVTCIDGDGAALMHLGSMASIGERKPANLRHIVLNNEAHDSVGGQPTIAGKIDLCGIARSCGYKQIYFVKTKEELQIALGDDQKPLFIEVHICKGNRKNLGRPDKTPIENKNAFMNYIRKWS